MFMRKLCYFRLGCGLWSCVRLGLRFQYGGVGGVVLWGDYVTPSYSGWRIAGAVAYV